MTKFRKNETQHKSKKSIQEAGALLIEMLAVLAIMSVMFPMMAKQDSLRKVETNNINVANQARRILEATDNLVKDKYSNLLKGPTLPTVDCTTSLAGTITISDLETSGNVITLNVDDLKNMGYLPCGMEDANKYGQTYSIAMKAIKIPSASTDKYRIDAMVVSQGGTPIPERNAAQIAEFIGAKGGYISNIFNIGNTSGTGGGWSMDVSNDFDFATSGLTETAGHISAFASSYVESANSSLHNPNILYRNKVDGFPEANTMQVELKMGGNDITNAGLIDATTVNATTANITGDLNVDTINITNILEAATITATGNLKSDTITADQGITITAGGLTITAGDITAATSDMDIKSINASGDITATGNITATGGSSIIEAASAFASQYNDTSPEKWVFGAQTGNSYSINPSHTSYMNDIKLASRGGARLSEILPNYILKEVKYYENISQYGTKPLFDDAPLYDSTSAYWGTARFNGQTYSFASDGAQTAEESATYPCPNDYDSALPYYKDPTTGACGATTPTAPNCGTAWTDDEVTNCKSGPLLGGIKIVFPTCPTYYKPIISVMPVKWDSAAARYCHPEDTEADCVALNLQPGDDPVFMSQDSGRIYVTAKVAASNDGWYLYMGQIYPQPISAPLMPAGTYIWNSPDVDPTNSTVKQREMGAVVNIYCYFDETVYDDITAPKIPTP